MIQSQKRSQWRVFKNIKPFSSLGKALQSRGSFLIRRTSKILTCIAVLLTFLLGICFQTLLEIKILYQINVLLYLVWKVEKEQKMTYSLQVLPSNIKDSLVGECQPEAEANHFKEKITMFLTLKMNPNFVSSLSQQLVRS